jgi:hypothetical protein
VKLKLIAAISALAMGACSRATGWSPSAGFRVARAFAEEIGISTEVLDRRERNRRPGTWGGHLHVHALHTHKPKNKLSRRADPGKSHIEPVHPIN